MVGYILKIWSEDDRGMCFTHKEHEKLMKGLLCTEEIISATGVWQKQAAAPHAAPSKP